MIAVDTNILVYAHREDSEWHQAAYQRLAVLAEGRAAWAILRFDGRKSADHIVTGWPARIPL